MKKIYKYPLNPLEGTAYTPVELPLGSRVVHFGFQNDKLFIWVEIPANTSFHSTHHFYVYGTGHLIPEHYDYRGTCFMLDGMFVWHLYEEA